MPDASTLLVFTVASLALLVIPGPAVIYLVARSLDQGRRAGLVSMLGIETGTFLYALAGAVGLTGLIAASEVGFTILRFGGAAYLVFLGVDRLRNGASAARTPAGGRGAHGYVRGVLVQLLNPKVAIFFLAFLPQFVSSSRGPVAAQVLLLGTLFTALAVITDGGYVLLAGALRTRLRPGRHTDRRVARLSGTLYIGLGVGAALSGSTRSG
ncbi:MAG TPA: LysE family translocator [Candidatus Dormibacteraeota bacterium]|nr:LysE family translocator [Candidatus Dormibacteraeota bacterium]